MTKTLIDNAERCYKLLEDDAGDRWLYVLCGTVGEYIAKIRLNPEEVQLYRDRGTEYLDDLAYDINHNPDKYKSRRAQ